MAVDTASKRYSMMRLGQAVGLLPIPDGTLAAADRAHLLGLYSGIALQAPELPVIGFVMARTDIRPYIGAAGSIRSTVGGTGSIQPAIVGGMQA